MEVPVIIIDDNSVDTIAMGLPKNSGSFQFTALYHGKLQDSNVHGYTASQQLAKYLNELQALEGPAIVFLDLGLKQNELNEEETASLTEWFPIGLDQNELDRRVDVGLYILRKALENPRWHGELCIVSDHIVAPTRRKLEQCLRNLPASIEGDQNEVRIGGVHVRFFGEGLVQEEQKESDVARRFADRAIKEFLKDFNDVWWFLHPPRLGSHASVAESELVWFPLDAHDGGPDFDIHLQAVKMRFQHWKYGQWAKALVACKRTRQYEVIPNPREKEAARFVGVECLQDFFGPEFELEGLECTDQIQLPTIPCFPFLWAAKRLFEELAKEGGKSKVVLRKVQSSVLALGIRTPEPWTIAWRLWTGARDGTNVEVYRNALQARIDLSGVTDLPHLKDVLNGLPHVAIPWITETFVGLAWTSPIEPILSLSA